MKQFPRLFHKTKTGSINIWDIWSDGDTIFTRWGKKDGKQQDAAKRAKGKNTGKKNATTDAEQAELEAKAMWTKKLERKYYETEAEATTEVVFLPMLADSFEKRKRFLTEDSYPATLQPKLDGLRMLASWSDDNSKVKLMSRGGKEYVLPHISALLETVLDKKDVLDGELYIHGKSLQELNRLVRGSHKYAESIDVQYHVYDIVPGGEADMPWIKRMKFLEAFHTKHDNTVARKVHTSEATDEQEVLLAQSKFMANGYEGAIVRLPLGTYRFGYRSKELLKVKSFQDAEFEITGFTNGIGKFENSIIYTCKTSLGKEFSVVPKGTFEQREVWLREGVSHIGKQLKVQFAAWTEDKIPQFPVGLCIRLEEDMD